MGSETKVFDRLIFMSLYVRLHRCSIFAACYSCSCVLPCFGIVWWKGILRGKMECLVKNHCYTARFKRKKNLFSEYVTKRSWKKINSEFYLSVVCETKYGPCQGLQEVYFVKIYKYGRRPRPEMTITNFLKNLYSGAPLSSQSPTFWFFYESGQQALKYTTTCLSAYSISGKNSLRSEIMMMT